PSSNDDLSDIQQINGGAQCHPQLMSCPGQDSARHLVAVARCLIQHEGSEVHEVFAGYLVDATFGTAEEPVTSVAREESLSQVGFHGSTDAVTVDGSVEIDGGMTDLTRASSSPSDRKSTRLNSSHVK